jgi:uncharacterized protein (TIGR03435 family)
MMKTISGAISLVGIVACGCFGQAVATARFEAISIKITPPSRRINGSYLLRGGPGTRDPGQITFTPITVAGLVMVAYDAPTYRIHGPEWLNTEQYDVVAKLPGGTTKDQYHLMLQNLLAERFGVRLHHEARALTGYELTVAKGGIKMRRAVTKIDDPQLAKFPDGIFATKDKMGLPQLMFGRKARSNLALPNGLLRISGRIQSAADIVEMCAREESAPVVDRTGLTGEYDFNLDFIRYQSTVPSSVQTSGDERRSQAEVRVPTEPAGPEFLAALREQLGLRLVKGKVSADVLVIDRAEKVPTGN